LTARYAPVVPWQPLSADTSDEAERLQIERWRNMTPEEKLALVSGMTQMACTLAMAGIEQRYPDASPRERFLRFAVLHLGEDLARLAYPEIAGLDLRT
jgi:hypothetical protein